MGSRGHNWGCSGPGECSGRCQEAARRRPRSSAARAVPAPEGGAVDPSPIEATFSRKRGIPAQPLLAASAAPQLAGAPAPEEGPAPPHLLAASLPLPFLSSGRAPPPPSSSPIFPHPVGGPLPPRLAGRLGRPRPEREAGAPDAAVTRGCSGERDPRPRGGPSSGPGTRGCLCTPSRGLASPRGGGGKDESRVRSGTAPGERRQAGRTPAAASSSSFSPTAL